MLKNAVYDQVYTECQSFISILDTPIGSKMNLFYYLSWEFYGPWPVNVIKVMLSQWSFSNLRTGMLRGCVVRILKVNTINPFMLVVLKTFSA